MDEHRGPTLEEVRDDLGAHFWVRSVALAVLDGVRGSGRDPVDLLHGLDTIARACQREAAGIERRLPWAGSLEPLEPGQYDPTGEGEELLEEVYR